jgi:TfoX/Sxy family transcriptional regulator of competence genes
MAYDEELTNRFRDQLGFMDGVSEKNMMGGVCFLYQGHMIGGASRNKKSGERTFMFRVGKDNEQEACERYSAQPLSFTGRKMGGLVEIADEACDDDQLKGLVSLAMSFVTQLPPKPAKEKSPKTI